MEIFQCKRCFSNNHICSICDIIYLTKKSMINHINTTCKKNNSSHHNKKNNNFQCKKCGSDNYFCPICGIIYLTKQSIIRHNNIGCNKKNSNNNYCERQHNVNINIEQNNINRKINQNYTNNKNNTKRKTIPKKVKSLIWDINVGREYGLALCICCKKTEISKDDFHCGHIISVANGGSNNIDNLKPICSGCNLSMHTQNMYEFMEQYM